MLKAATYYSSLRSLVELSALPKSTFTRLGKYEKLIAENPKVKDLTQNPIVSGNIEDMRGQFKRDNTISGLQILSEAITIPKKHIKFGKEFHVDRKQINKVIKKHAKKDIDKAQKDSYDYLVENDYLQLNYSRIEENKRLIHETNQFKKLFFEKREIKRLLKMQQRKIENNLPLSQLAKEHAQQAQEFNEYTQSNLQMKNQRISNMLNGTSKENKKLALLISSGLLDTSKNIKQIISTSVELISQQQSNSNQQQSSSPSPHDGIYGRDDNQYQDIIVQSKSTSSTTSTETEDGLINDIDNDNDSIESTDVYAADKLLLASASGTSVPQTTTAASSKEQLMELYADKISQMGFDLTIDELGFVDFEALALFFNEFIACSPEDRLRTLSKIQLIESLRAYENQLFDKYRNNDISLRVQGQLQYKDLTPKEQLNYIKYNIKKPSDVFLMMTNLPEEHLTPSILSQMTARIATFRFESKQNYLAIIGNYNYRALLRHTLNNIPDMTNDELVDLIWSLGKIHQHEHGVVYEKLFHRIMDKISTELTNRIPTIPLSDVSFMTRGYCKLHHLALNSQLNSVLLASIRSQLQALQGENLSVYAIQGLLLYTSFVNTLESKQILGEYLLPLLSKQEILSQIDRTSLSEICLSLASITTTYKTEISAFLANAAPQIHAISKSLDTDTISDVMVVASACSFTDKLLFQELKKRVTFNFREQKPCSEVAVSKLLCAFAQHDLDRSLSRHLDGDHSQKNISLFDNLLLFSYFPTLLFHQQSPQYSFYNRICKEIDRVKHTFTPKWISLSVFGVAAVSYKNMEFLDDCSRTILQSQEDHNNSNPAATKPSTHNINELAMVLFGYSNMKQSTSISKQLLHTIRNLFMENKFSKATSLAWAQFFNALANTLHSNEIDEIEQAFAEIVFRDKIQATLNFLSTNMKVSLIFSLSRLRVDPEILLQIYDSLNPRDLNNFHFYLLNLSLQYTSSHSTDAEITAPQYDSLRMKEVDAYILKTIADKYNFTENARFTYEQTSLHVKNMILEHLLQSNPNASVSSQLITNHFDTRLSISIDFLIPQSKTAVFLYTLDHCISQEKPKEEEDHETNKSPHQLMGIFQTKEDILTANGYSIIRIFAHEFNAIGFNLPIEQEKTAKKLYIRTLLQPMTKKPLQK